MLSIKTIGDFPNAEKVKKNILYGTAVGLTRTAQQGQAAVIAATRQGFNVRGSWLNDKGAGKFGIKIKTAKPNDLEAIVKTAADWLEKQSKGGRVGGAQNIRTYHYTFEGVRYIAIPSRAVRPPGSKRVIPKNIRPGALRRKKSTFVVRSAKTNTPIVFSRYGPGKDQVEAMYILKPDIAIKPRDTFITPIDKVVARRLGTNIETEIEKALRTME